MVIYSALALLGKSHILCYTAEKGNCKGHLLIGVR